MLRKLKLFSMTALIAVMTVLTVKAEIVQDYNSSNNNYNNNNYGQIKIDRYLDVEVWTNHTDNEFYEGDNIVLSFRANQDAFVAIYTVDSKGRVNLLFPSSLNGNHFVKGGETYRLPDYQDDFDFVVSGPEGVETIQIIASKERFPIPDWYPTSGIIDDAEDRNDFMDYINSRYFVRYDGQRFAFDRSSIYINEWEDDYYRPTYYPSYPSWTVAGNVYIDYPYGGSVYIDGIYWGVAPLYIPRIYVGWHTFTIYDSYGYCWENDWHVTRYNTVVLNRNIVRTSPNVRSKYKEVRTVGYRNPVNNGYPKYKSTKVLSTKNKTVKTTKVITTKKRYVRGSTDVVKTKRGYETTGKTIYQGKRNSNSKTAYEKNNKRSYNGSSKSAYRKKTSERSSGSNGTYKRSTGKSSSSGKSSNRTTSTYKKKRTAKQSSKSSKVEKRSSTKKSSSKKASKVEKQSKKSSKSSSGSKSGSYKKSDNSARQSKSSGSAHKSSSGKSSSSRGGKSKR